MSKKSGRNIDREIHYCKRIASKPVSFFFQKGSSARGRKVLILGESLAKRGWIDSGRAFYTAQCKLVPSGKRLNEELAAIGLTLEECAFTEVAKCYIGQNRKLLRSCGLACAAHLLGQINKFRPSVILSLGVTTRDILENTFNTDLPMGEVRRVARGTRFYYFLSLYHPSPANPSGHAKNMAIIQKHKRRLKELIN